MLEGSQGVTDSMTLGKEVTRQPGIISYAILCAIIISIIIIIIDIIDYNR